jgi:hypothetical protein
MTNVTYRDLERFISNMSDKQKNCDVTIFVSGVAEFYSLVDPDANDILYPMCEADETDVLDIGHPYLTI